MKNLYSSVYKGIDIYTYGTTYSSINTRQKFIEFFQKIKPQALCLEVSANPVFGHGAWSVSEHLKKLDNFLSKDASKIIDLISSEEVLSNKDVYEMELAILMSYFLGNDLWAVEPYWPLAVSKLAGNKKEYGEAIRFYIEVREPLVAINVMHATESYNGLSEKTTLLNITGSAHAKRIANLIASYPSWYTSHFSKLLQEKINYFTEIGTLEPAESKPAGATRLYWEEIFKLIQDSETERQEHLS